MGVCRRAGPSGIAAGGAAKRARLPGARYGWEGGNSLRLHRPVTHLAKLYVEPTNACNLDCITCFRNAWESRSAACPTPPLRPSWPGWRAEGPAHGLLRRDRRAAVAPPHGRVDRPGAGDRRTRGDDHQRHAAQRNARGRTDRRRAGPALGLHRRCGPESYADVRLGAELPT